MSSRDYCVSLSSTVKCLAPYISLSILVFFNNHIFGIVLKNMFIFNQNLNHVTQLFSNSPTRDVVRCFLILVDLHWSSQWSAARCVCSQNKKCMYLCYLFKDYNIWCIVIIFFFTLKYWYCLWPKKNPVSAALHR